jgi:DNA processing protein
MEPAELAAWLRLLLTPGLGRVGARRLLSACGSPQAVFERHRLDDVPDLDKIVAEHAAWLRASSRHHAIPLGDERYPADLLHTEDPPLLLFGLGQAELLQHPLRVAVVGSRNPSAQGELNARQFSQALAEAGVCVVSGLALGVDGAAHEGALAAHGKTIAVVGTGLDRVYPSRHRDLAHRIAQDGLLLSEYPLGTPPLAAHFPQRNRILSGLCQGTLVVEAALQSGSLITARLAAEQGREVFAIPGSIHSPQARGCHALIRQGAKLVESAQDILEELHAQPASQAMQQSGDVGTAPAVSEDERQLLDALGHAPMGFDALQARTGLPTALLQARLLELELTGHIARQPGGMVQRLVRI